MCKCNKKKSCENNLCIFKLQLIEKLLIQMNIEILESINIVNLIDENNLVSSQNELKVLFNVLLSQVSLGSSITNFNYHGP